MSKASRSVYYYGFWVTANGLFLMLFPNVVGSLSGLPVTGMWPRLAGSLFAFVGVYYITAGRADFRPFVRMTVWGRCWFIATTMVFAASGVVPWQAVLITWADWLTTVWTAVELIREHQSFNPFTSDRPMPA